MAARVDPAAEPRVVPSRWRSTRGVSLAVHAAAGEVALVLHGIGGNADTCEPLARRLAAAGYHTLAWDAPGYGESADPTDPVVDHAGEVIAVLEELEVAPVHLVGTSWGGVIAAQVAARRPDLLGSLVLADSTRGSGTEPTKARAMRARVADLTALGPRAFAASRAPRLVAASCPGAIATSVEAGMAQVRVPGYAPAAEHMAATDLGGLLPTLTVPTLVLVGAEDVVTGVPESELLARLVPGARLVVVPDAGHAAFQEQPDAVARHLTRFWQEVSR